MLNIATANNYTMLFGLIFIHFLGYLFANKYILLRTKIQMLSIGGGLLIYTILSIFFLKLEFIFSPPLISSIAFYFPILIRYFKQNRFIHFAFIITILIYSLYIYPSLVNRKFSNNTLNSIDWIHNKIEFINRDKENEINKFEKKVILFETWNETCGSCFQAMNDLHNYFLKLESKYPQFKHYYIYVPLKNSNIDTYNYNKLPYPDLPILVDREARFYNKYLPQSFPQFLLMSNNEILYSIEGYNKRYSSYYKDIISSNLKKIVKLDK